MRSPLKAALEVPISAPGQVLREIRAFIEPRIIKPPSCANRAQWEETAAQAAPRMLEESCFAARPPSGERRSVASNGSIRSTAGPAIGFASSATRPCRACGFRGCLSARKAPDAGRVAMHVNGHAPEGKAVDYKQLRSINLAKRGMLVLNLEWFGMGQFAHRSGFAHGRMNQLELCGASGLAPFYLALSRGARYGHCARACRHEPRRRLGSVGRRLADDSDQLARRARDAGQSGGRLRQLSHEHRCSTTWAIPSKRRTDMAIGGRLHAPDRTAGAAAHAAHLQRRATTVASRSGTRSSPLVEAARPIFALYGAEDRLRSHVNHVPGTHNFEQENREQLYAVIGDFLFRAMRHLSATRLLLSRN